MQVDIAHGDLNTPETTRSGFLDGMALSVLLGRCWTGLATGVGLDGGLKLGVLLQGIAWIQDRGPIEAVALTAYDPSGDPDGAVVETAFRVLEQVLDAG